MLPLWGVSGLIGGLVAIVPLAILSDHPPVVFSVRNATITTSTNPAFDAGRTRVIALATA